MKFLGLVIALLGSCRFEADPFSLCPFRGKTPRLLLVTPHFGLRSGSLGFGVFFFFFFKQKRWLGDHDMSMCDCFTLLGVISVDLWESGTGFWTVFRGGGKRGAQALHLH